MNNYLSGVVLIVFCVFTVNGIQWKDCGSTGSKVTSIEVQGCETAKICPLHKGQNATFSVSFKSNEDFSSATAVVHGILVDIPVPFPIPNPDGCKSCGLTCPVKSGTDNKYSTVIAIKDSYPKVRVVVKWELKDENKKDIFCVEIPAEVVDSVNMLH